MIQTSYDTTITSLDYFSLLKSDFIELYRVAKQAEKYVNDDRSACLVKVRLFAELWCHEVSDIIRLRPPVHGDLQSKIKQLQACGKIPDYLIEALQDIRFYGNRSAHTIQKPDGQWHAEINISAKHLTTLMQHMVELAQHLLWIAHKIPLNTNLFWQQPKRSECTELVNAALNEWDRDAMLALAKHYATLLEVTQQNVDATGETKRIVKQDYQSDLQYWIEKAQRFEHPEVALLYAQCFDKKLLILPENKSVEDYFKQAVKHDISGESHYCYGHYLLRQQRVNSGLKLLTHAAEQHHEQAITMLISHYRTKDHMLYQHWVAQGVEAAVSGAYPHAIAALFDQWCQRNNDEKLTKQLRSMLITAESRQVAGTGFFIGYCRYYGYANYKQDKVAGLAQMVKHHLELPIYLRYPDLMFEVLRPYPEHRALALKYGEISLLCSNGSSTGQLKFDVAMLGYEKMKEDKVKSPVHIKQLLQQSADEGYKAAREYLATTEGKQLLKARLPGQQVIGRPTVNRTKQKQQRKAARKAKC